MREGAKPGMKPIDPREEWTITVGSAEGMLEKRCLNEAVSSDGVTMAVYLEAPDMVKTRQWDFEQSEQKRP